MCNMARAEIFNGAHKKLLPTNADILFHFELGYTSLGKNEKYRFTNLVVFLAKIIKRNNKN